LPTPPPFEYPIVYCFGAADGEAAAADGATDGATDAAAGARSDDDRDRGQHREAAHDSVSFHERDSSTG
jgi:hypothetical protein